MLYQKTGLPDEGELLLCTITKIQPNSVFVRIDEYNMSGMIHISEISPGRIRNIRDFVKEDKKVVCIVIRVNQERGHVDLSLRRVNDAQRKRKIESIKQLQKAEKILEYVGEKVGLTTKQMFTEVTEAISADYSTLVPFFYDVINNDLSFSKYKINAKYAELLESIVRQRIKPDQVTIEGEFDISCYAENGLEIIKKAFEPVDPNKATYYYLGGGRYFLSITSPNYKEGEAQLEEIKSTITVPLEKAEATISFKRITKKK